MPRPVAFRTAQIALALALTSTVAVAGPITGKLELPAAPPYPEPTVKGFLDRTENPKKPVASDAVAPYLLVVLVAEGKTEGIGQVVWEVVGESFNKPVVGVPVGGELMIKNCAVCRARQLRAAEDPKLVPPGPLNPTGGKTFKLGEARTYTIGDADSPYLSGKLVVVPSPYIAYVDASGKFELTDLPEGSYKLKVFYKDGWIDRPDDAVTVAAKTKDLGTFKVPRDYPRKSK